MWNDFDKTAAKTDNRENVHLSFHQNGVIIIFISGNTEGLSYTKNHNALFILIFLAHTDSTCVIFSSNC